MATTNEVAGRRAGAGSPPSPRRQRQFEDRMFDTGPRPWDEPPPTNLYRPGHAWRPWQMLTTRQT